MAYCKICDCGRKIVFDDPQDYPPRCPNPECGRYLDEYITYDENDPAAERELEQKRARINRIKEQASGKEEEAPAARQQEDDLPKRYYLRLSNGVLIEIPKEGGIIGRTGIGAEELAEFPSVSRHHLKATPRRNAGVIIEDVSTYGTIADGERLEKNVPKRITVGAKLVLCNVEAELIALGVREDD